MEKVFISAESLLQDSFRLAEKIYLSGFTPDLIVGVWRGGTPIAIAIQEYFEYLGQTTDHISIRTSSYTGINQQSSFVKVDGLDYIANNIRSHHKVLLVDDVFDTGRSVQAILTKMAADTASNMPTDIHIACPWYKPSKNLTKLEPNHFINTTDSWLVFPHELKGLTLDEIKQGKSSIIDFIQPHLER